MQAVSDKKLEFGTAADSKKLEAGGLLEEILGTGIFDGSYMYVAFDWYLRYLLFVLLYEPLRNRVEWSLNETNEASLLPKLHLPVVNPIRLFDILRDVAVGRAHRPRGPVPKLVDV